MEVGRFGKRLLDLLWMPTIISIIECWTIYAENIVILHLEMDLLSILKRMTPGNFNWFLHTMLFYHTKYVLRKQEMKKSEADEEENLGLDEEAQDNEDNSIVVKTSAEKCTLV